MKFDWVMSSRMGGISLIFLVGMIHLVTAPDHFKAAPWIGWSFLVLVLGTLVAVVGIAQGMGWGWLLGALLAGGAFVAFIISRTAGLPGFGEAIGKWEPMGIYSLFVEALFILLAILVGLRERNTNVHSA